VSTLSRDYSTAHKESNILFEVHAEFSHGDHQVILSSETMTVEALIERARQDEKICAFAVFNKRLRSQLNLKRLVIDLKPEFEDEDNVAPAATIAFFLSATPIIDSNRGDIKRVIISKIGPRERWAKLVDFLQGIIRIGTGIAEVRCAKLVLVPGRL